jgi:hypothetical protein
MIIYKQLISNVKNRVLRDLVPQKLEHTQIDPFRTDGKAIFDTSWGYFRYYWKAEVSLNDIFATMRSDCRMQERVKIEQTPHYKYVMNYLGYIEDYDLEYEHYISRYFPENNMRDRLKAFDWIIENSKYDNSLSVEYKNPNALLKVPSVVSEGLVLIDGLHRCSALTALSKKTIVAALKF